jgi:uncharacterized membrane protein YeaQ/YmgE (transglycosylase-associated protein family)
LTLGVLAGFIANKIVHQLGEGLFGMSSGVYLGALVGGHLLRGLVGDSAAYDLLAATVGAIAVPNLFQVVWRAFQD